LYLYDEKVKTSREATLKYKEENGIMRKKFTVLQKEMEDQKTHFPGGAGRGGQLSAAKAPSFPRDFLDPPAGSDFWKKAWRSSSNHLLCQSRPHRKRRQNKRVERVPTELGVSA